MKIISSKESPTYEIDGRFHTDGDFSIMLSKFDAKFAPLIKKVNDEDYSLHFETNCIQEAIWFLEQLFVSYDVSYTHYYVLEDLLAMTNEIYKHLTNRDKGKFSSELKGNYEGTELSINIKEQTE